MAKLTAQQFREKWQQNIGSSGTRVTAGVNAVQQAPSQKAIQAKQKMITRWNQSVNDGKWERGLQKVTLQDWKQAMLDKGIQRMQQGASAPQTATKVEQFASKLLAHQDSYLPTIQAMPSTTLEDNINRAVANIRAMSNFDPSA